MTILGFSLTEFSTGMVGVGLMGYGALKGAKEWVARRRGLKANPTRCKEHEDKITALQLSSAHTDEWRVATDKTLGEIKAGVDRLVDLHIKP